MYYAWRRVNLKTIPVVSVTKSLEIGIASFIMIELSSVSIMYDYYDILHVIQLAIWYTYLTWLSKYISLQLSDSSMAYPCQSGLPS